MNTAVKAGLMIGVFCTIWMTVMGVTGWYRDPVLLNLFYIVIFIEIGVLVWGLRKEAAAGAGYGALVGRGTMMAVVGAVVIFLGSLLFTMVLYPHYFEELRAIGEEMMRAQGVPEAEARKMLDAQAAMQTPVVNALTGSIATVITGLVASMIIALFVRKKTSPAG